MCVFTIRCIIYLWAYSSNIVYFYISVEPKMACLTYLMSFLSLLNAVCSEHLFIYSTVYTLMQSIVQISYFSSMQDCSNLTSFSVLYPESPLKHYYNTIFTTATLEFVKFGAKLWPLSLRSQIRVRKGCMRWYLIVPQSNSARNDLFVGIFGIGGGDFVTDNKFTRTQWDFNLSKWNRRSRTLLVTWMLVSWLSSLMSLSKTSLVNKLDQKDHAGRTCLWMSRSLWASSSRLDL